MKVCDFRKNALYQRSLDLAHEVYRTVEEDGENIGEIEALQLRKQAVRITKKITHAIVQQNIKMKFKNLNEAKNKLEKLLEEIYRFCDDGKISDWNGHIVESFGYQVMKLIKYNFGKYKNSEG